MTVATADGTTKTLTVSILGTNDAAVITGTSTASLTETNAVLSTSGSLSASDVDSSASFIAQTGAAGSNAYGKFSIDAAGAWSYTADTAHNEFVGGTTYTDSITVATADGTQQVVTVTIAGTNDAAVISGVSTASLTETNTVLTATGSLTVTDVDSATTFVAQANVAGDHAYGAFSITSDGVWNYTADTAHNVFAVGTTYSDSITVASADGTHHDISVSISGTVVAGDGNGDGVVDSQQPAVASAPFLNTSTAISNPSASPATFVTMVADSIAGVVDTTDVGSALLTNMQQLDAPVTLPSAMQMPLGELSFTAVVDTVGISETFSLFVDSTLNVNGYWSQNSDGTWVNLATHIETVGGITRIDFTVTDGGAYDIDHTADGTITDNGAVGSMPLSIVGVVPVATQGGFFF